jgi:ABC-type multidrug transport system fused ATPase/permease subunit
MQSRHLLEKAFLLVGLLAYMLTLNWKLTLLLLITTPFIALIVYVAGRRLRKLAKTIQTAMGDVTHLASEAVDGNLEINHLMQKNMKKIGSLLLMPQIKIKI